MDNRGKFQHPIPFMKTGRYLILASLGILPFLGTAQVTDTTKPAPMSVAITEPAASDTNVHIYAPTAVKSTEQKIYDYQRYSRGTSPAFRVQITFSQQRDAMNRTQSSFSGKYPGTHCYVSYKQPYFRVSVGDFRTKLEAVSFLNKVRRDYPGAFVVVDKIVPPPLQ